ncbi:MAG: T9SS type A sorting domain-containing protein [Bacteroidetes bacterium]|nr:T9SS type A sorting domain-containing protein [Bacteroidota bacterium]
MNSTRQIKIFVLIIFQSISVFSQNPKPHIIKKVYTNKTLYTYGETVLITIRAINTSSTQDTLIFPDLCEAYPYVDNDDYLINFGLGCYLSISERIIPAQDSIEWIYEYPHPSKPGMILSVGQHSVFGYFRETYPNSDTIGFYVKEGPSAVEKEPKQNILILEQNYPNPFNPFTKIKYELPKSGFVRMVIYDNLGRVVKVLVNEIQFAGSYEININAMELSSGVYYYRIQANEYSATKKFVLIK